MATTKTTLSITEARKKIYDLAEDVQKPGKHYVLTEKGKPKAVLMSAEEFDSLIENLEILSDPKVMARIKKAEREFERGEYVSWDEAKRQLGWDKLEPELIRDKPKKGYRTKLKRRKTK